MIFVGKKFFLIWIDSIKSSENFITRGLLTKFLHHHDDVKRRDFFNLFYVNALFNFAKNEKNWTRFGIHIISSTREKYQKFCGISIVLSTSIKTCLHVKKTIIEINYSTKFSHHACQKRRLKFYEMFKYFPFMSKSQKLLPF